MTPPRNPALEDVPLAELLSEVMRYVDFDTSLVIEDGLRIYVEFGGKRYVPADDLSDLVEMLDAAALMARSALPEVAA